MACERLYVAARTNNVTTLDEMLQTNPQILFSASVEPSDNPLHVAALFGHTDFAKAIMDQYPRLSRERNDKGYYPIHLASSKGHSEFVSQLLERDPYNEQCFLADREGRTPLQLAAIKGQEEVVRVLLTRCSESAKEVTKKNETVLHLVVKYNVCEVMELLLSLLHDSGLLDEIINYKDEDGKTVLQLAAARNKPQMLKILSRNTRVDVNAVNDAVLTALETSSEINDNPTSVKTKTTSKKKIFPLRVKEYVSGILVLNSLLATISFDALLNLPGSMPERGLGGNVTHSRGGNVTDNLVVARMFYTPYKLVSVAGREVFNVTAPAMQLPIDASSYVRSDPFHFISFLGFSSMCFFLSLATIIMTLAISIGLPDFFVGLVPIMCLVSVTLAAFLYTSVLAIVTNTSTAFLLAPSGCVMFALSLLSWFVLLAFRISHHWAGKSWKW